MRSLLQKSNYDNLYLDILKIGRERSTSGLSFNSLKCILTAKGYDMENDCIDMAVKQWFFDSFHHKNEKSKVLKSVNHLEKHLDCNFIMKGESCLQLIEHETAKRNLRIALVAAFIAIASLIYGVFSDNPATYQGWRGFFFIV